MAYDPSYPAFPIFSIIGFVLVLIPLPWHLQAWNSGTCLFMLWTAIGCLNLFVNSIVWQGNAIDWAPTWCDISSRLTVGISVGIPAASLCINRRLYKIASANTVTSSRTSRRNVVLVDLAIGLGIPLLQMPLQYIVQGHRYDIFEDIGCYPTTVNTPPAYPLVFLWPTVVGLVSAVYCVLTLRAFMIRRAQFAQLISSHNSSITISRYFRLMSLATLELIINLPITSYGLYLNASRPIYHWVSWADIHFQFNIIDAFPRLLWGSSNRTVVTLELNRWLVVFCAFLFFGFFGFADEARKNYSKALLGLKNLLGFKPSPAGVSEKNAGFMYPASPQLPSHLLSTSPSLSLNRRLTATLHSLCTTPPRAVSPPPLLCTPPRQRCTAPPRNILTSSPTSSLPQRP
ncbi:pheromone receptor, partial [Coprinopsis sp. MPI-PUGE-AT-0042]